MKRTTHYTVPPGDRDSGKTFVLTEMSSDQGEWWATRALLALGKSGVELPDGIQQEGVAGLARVGLDALFKLSPVDVRPLFDELWDACVQYMPDPHKPSLLRAPIPEDIEEIKTRLTLRWEALKLHVDFSKAAASLKSATSKAAAEKPVRSRTTRTSRK